MLRSLLRSRFLPSCVVVVTLAGACSDGPERSFEKFYDALAAGDADAIERLSARARAQLDDDARKALLATPPQASVKSVRVVEIVETSEPNRATLEVVDVLGDKDEVRMIREDGAWRVDL
jgi:hypothetical protein